MGVTLTTYPVITESGKIRNIFAGFDAVELTFQRSDIDIVNISSGADAKILIDVAGDITSALNVGEGLYLFGEGLTYTYDLSAKILDINYNAPNTEITIDAPFIQVASSGYVNYKQNWFLEAKLVDPDNNLVWKYPSLLSNDGDPSGVVNINTSMLVDALYNDIAETSQEITTAREICKVMYREVWRENQTEAFILVDDEPIIIIYAAENAEIESFINGFDLPKIWAGYPFAINLLHSVENLTENRIAVTFDELDINQNNVTVDNPLTEFGNDDFGILQANFSDNQKAIESN